MTYREKVNRMTYKTETWNNRIGGFPRKHRSHPVQFNMGKTIQKSSSGKLKKKKKKKTEVDTRVVLCLSFFFFRGICVCLWSRVSLSNLVR